MRPRVVLLAAGAALLLSLVSPTPVRAQILDRVDRLARSGQAEEARTLLLGWWEDGREEASRREAQQGLWLRALLTVDPVQARLDFQRLAVEYPAGPYTPGALARLGAIAHALDEPLEAEEHYRSLLRDHPGSPEAPEARDWLERNETRVARARAAAEAEAAAEDEPRGDANPSEPPEAEAPAGDVTIQLGAFAQTGRARELAAEVADALGGAGLEPRLVTVEGSELVRVRVGRFASRREARELYDRLRGAGFEALIVTDAARETPTGGGAGG